MSLSGLPKIYSTSNVTKDRAGEAITTALDITNTLIQDMIVESRENMSDIFSLVDSVALLDMLGYVIIASIVTYGIYLTTFQVLC